LRRIVTPVIVLAVCATLSACGSSSAPPSTSTTTPSLTSSPKVALAAMRNAAHSQHSVHYVSVSSAPGHTIRIVADVDATEGIQRVTFTDHGQTGSGTAIVSGDTAYIRGNAVMMSVYFGFPKAKATKYAGKWISVPSSNPAYATDSDDVTFPSFLSHLFPRQTKISLVKAGFLIGVHGTVQGQSGVTLDATVFAPAHGQPLPVKQTAKSSDHLGTGVLTISNWNEAVDVSAPANAVPISKVVGG